MEYDSQQAVAFAMAGKPVEFANQVHTGLSDRILDAIEAKRVETASKIFGTPEYAEANPEPEVETVETPEEEETPSPDESDDEE